MKKKLPVMYFVFYSLIIIEITSYYIMNAFFTLFKTRYYYVNNRMGGDGDDGGDGSYHASRTTITNSYMDISGVQVKR